MKDEILENVKKYQKSECQKLRQYIIEHCTAEEIKEILESFGIKS